MIDDSWQSVVFLCIGFGTLSLLGRWAVTVLSRRQLAMLAREGRALQRCWSLIDRVPADLLPQTTRRVLGTVMYLHLERARRAQPDHPFLRAQQAQIGRFIARTLDEPYRVRHAARGSAERALVTLRGLLDEATDEGRIGAAESARAQAGIDGALRQLAPAAHRRDPCLATYGSQPAF